MKILETINNALDTVQSIEGILREARAYAAEARDTRLEIENRKLLDQNWSLVEERDACLADTERLNVQLAGCLTAAEGGTSEPVVAKSGDYGWSVAYQATLDLRRKYDSTLRAKSEPVASGVGEPDYGIGFEKCSKSDAAEWILWLSDKWGTWEPIGHMCGAAPANDYRFRRPIAKPAVEAAPIEPPVVPPV